MGLFWTLLGFFGLNWAYTEISSIFGGPLRSRP